MNTDKEFRKIVDADSVLPELLKDLGYSQDSNEKELSYQIKPTEAARELINTKGRMMIKVNKRFENDTDRASRHAIRCIINDEMDKLLNLLIYG